MIDPHPSSMFSIRGGGPATQLCTSLTLTALHGHAVIQLVASATLHAFIPYNLTLKAFSYLRRADASCQC